MVPEHYAWDGFVYYVSGVKLQIRPEIGSFVSTIRHFSGGAQKTCAGYTAAAKVTFLGIASVYSVHAVHAEKVIIP